MSTKIIDQKYFKDVNNKIHVIDVMQMNRESWRSEIQDEWNEVSKEEADFIANPPISELELEHLERQKLLNLKKSELSDINLEITMFERIANRSEYEEAELQELNANSVVLFREIKALEKNTG